MNKIGCPYCGSSKIRHVNSKTYPYFCLKCKEKFNKETWLKIDEDRVLRFPDCQEKEFRNREPIYARCNQPYAFGEPLELNFEKD
jgi:DNA-directed RNA polymerase subunit RPC12/RpoP